MNICFLQLNNMSLKALKLSVILVLLLFFCSCAGKQVKSSSAGFYDNCRVTKVLEGEASYYGKKFHGRKTASGAIFDMYADTGAHKTLPLNTYVRVTNLANEKQLIVLINDRGPYVGNRILDLSKGAASKLGYINQGVTRVRIEVLENGNCNYNKNGNNNSNVATPVVSGGGNIEVGFYETRWRADRIYHYLKGRYKTIRIVEENGGFSVVIGPFTSNRVKMSIFSKLKSEGYDVRVK